MNRSEQRHNIYKMLSIALICLFFGLGIGYSIAKNPIALLQPQGCTMEAKICPDGSAVGRLGPSCEFAPCPTATPSPIPMDTDDWKMHMVETEPTLGLTNYIVKVPASWLRIEHSSNFQNTETFKSDVEHPIYTLTITQEENLNKATGKQYGTLREYTGLSYDGDTVTVDGLTATKVLPRAGSEHIFKVVSFSKDKKVLLSISLETPMDGSLNKEGAAFLTQILASFKFISSPNDAYFFTKRVSNLNGFGAEQNKLLSEISTITDEQLIGLSCSNYYDGLLGILKSRDNKELTDPILKKITQSDPNIYSIQSCATEKGQTIIIIGAYDTASATKVTTHYSLRSSSGTLINIASIPDGGMYSSCNSPIMLTNKNILYWACSGGDGGFGQSSIYAIDLNNNSSRRIIKCTSTADSSADNPVGTSTTKCE